MSLFTSSFRTLTDIGPAVFNGGLSTLLAILMLVNSKSYVFITFFKVYRYHSERGYDKYGDMTNRKRYLLSTRSYLFLIPEVFFLVIVLGLFHGLVLLPVILSLVGPPPYRHYTQAPTQEPEQPTDKSENYVENQ